MKTATYKCPLGSGGRLVASSKKALARKVDFHNWSCHGPCAWVVCR